MALQLNPDKQSIDIGIVVRDSAKALAFYRDTLGMEHIADQPMPVGGGGTMHRLGCGSVTVKVVAYNNVPELSNPGGGLMGASGFRYFTISITNIVEATDQCAAAGYKVAMPVTEIRPGVRISMIEDPDGNWVELLQAG